MDNESGIKIPGEENVTKLQRLKERAKSISVDRFFTQPTVGVKRETSVARRPPIMNSTTTSAHKQPRKSRPVGPSTTATREPAQRFRSPSLNDRLQNNLQNLASFLFERKNDAKKQALAERLLWTALRKNQVDLLRDILEQMQDPPVDINLTNQLGWNMVDEAVMLGHVEIAGELFKRGAKETPQLRTKSQRQDALKSGLRELELIQASARIKENTTARLLAADVATGSTFALLQQMLHNVEKSRPPRNYLDHVSIQAWGDTAIAVHFQARTAPPGVISRFKVEWCRERHFESGVEQETFYDVMNPDELVIDGLTTGQSYFIRLSVANMAGFGMPVIAQPFPLVITSWREVDNKKEISFSSQTQMELEQILQNVKSVEHLVKNNIDRKNLGLRTVQRRPSLKESLKAIMKPQPKSTYLEDGGLFLGCLIVKEDSILLTNELTLPVQLIQSPFLGSISAKQYIWLQKICSVPSLTSTLKDLLHSSKDSTSDLRYSIVQAISRLQTILNLENLGNPYFHAIQDDNASLSLLLLVKRSNTTEDYRPGFGLKWVHIKEVELMSLGPCDEILALLASTGISDIISYNYSVQNKIPTGLYLGFIQLQPSLDNVAVVVSKSHPNVLPCVKVQNNPHITREEWKLLLGQLNSQAKPNISAENFRNKILLQWNSLKTNLSLKSVDQPYLYESVLQLGPHRTMIVLYTDSKGIISRQSLDEELRRGTLSMAVQTLESVYFDAYRQDQWNIYCRASLLLDALSLYCNQYKRETFTSDLNDDIKSMASQIESQQDRLEKVWNKTRWLPEIIRTVTYRAVKPKPLFHPTGLAIVESKKPFPAKPIIYKEHRIKYDHLSVAVAIQRGRNKWSDVDNTMPNQK